MGKIEFSIAVLISGGGTTLRNLIARRDSGELPVEIALVVASNPQAGGIRFAADANIPVVVVDHRNHSTPESISPQVFEVCRSANVDLVVMGGFLRKVQIPEDFENRVINIHPSLIPAFCGPGMYGLRVHAAVLDKGLPITGCTVHFVDNQYDHGPIIAQQSVVVEANDTPESLANRVFQTECELYPRVIAALARGEIHVAGDEVVVAPFPPSSIN